jgi:hypothetical protein
VLGGLVVAIARRVPERAAGVAVSVCLAGLVVPGLSGFDGLRGKRRWAGARFCASSGGGCRLAARGGLSWYNVRDVQAWGSYLNAVFAPWWKAGKVPVSKDPFGLAVTPGLAPLDEDLEAWTLGGARDLGDPRT